MGHNHVELEAEDGIKISADFYQGGDKGIILLHEFTKTKKVWDDFASELQKLGYTLIAIDLRGHGQSDLNYQSFTDEDFNNILLDARAARGYINKNKNLVMGASIGANIALKFANEVDAAIALSPGINYKGIDVELDSKIIERAVLIIASEEDAYSAQSSEKLNKIIRNSRLKMYNNKGHGTKMLDKETKDFIISWIQENF